MKVIKQKPQKSSSMAYVSQMLKKPRNQQAEALYNLMYYYKAGCTRRSLMQNCHIMNAPQVISLLRKRGITILCNMVKKKNKYGRPIKYGVYKLQDFKQGVFFYEIVNEA